MTNRLNFFRDNCTKGGQISPPIVPPPPPPSLTQNSQEPRLHLGEVGDPPLPPCGGKLRELSDSEEEITIVILFLLCHWENQSQIGDIIFPFSKSKAKSKLREKK